MGKYGKSNANGTPVCHDCGVPLVKFKKNMRACPNCGRIRANINKLK